MSFAIVQGCPVRADGVLRAALGSAERHGLFQEGHGFFGFASTPRGTRGGQCSLVIPLAEGRFNRYRGTSEAGNVLVGGGEAGAKGRSDRP